MNYHNITKDDMLNGDGLRTVLWVSGCSHHCEGCQNPQTWDINSGILFDEAAKKELLESLDNPWISGLTLSGGDPLNEHNLEVILNLVREVKNKYKETKTIWIYSGYTYEDILSSDSPDMKIRQKILSYCDVFVDGKFDITQKDISYEWAGSRNQKVIRLSCKATPSIKSHVIRR